MKILKNIIKNPWVIFTTGLIVAFMIVFFTMPSMMIVKRKSTLSFDQTIEKISTNIRNEGWSIMGVRRIDNSIKNHGRDTKIKVALIELCHPDYANAIISDRTATHISVMMPCTISVYENEEHEVSIATMNTAPMGYMFGGIVKEIMAGKVAPAQKKFLDLNS